MSFQELSKDLSTKLDKHALDFGKLFKTFSIGQDLQTNLHPLDVILVARFACLFATLLFGLVSLQKGANDQDRIHRHLLELKTQVTL